MAGKKIVWAVIATAAGILLGVWLAFNIPTKQKPRPDPAATQLPNSPTLQVSITPIPTPTTHATPTPKPSKTATPSAVNLEVPFTPQAPFGIWDPIHEELCEEASVLMVASYVQHTRIPNPATADTLLLAIKEFEEKRFGYFESTTAEETAIILREFYELSDVKLKHNPTSTDIKTALASGKLVIAPAAGRLLGNPFFTPPGPVYHMLVVKGYTADNKFITNDPGTRRGADFAYEEAVFMNAIHDWTGDSNIEESKKVIIIVG